MSEIYNQHAHLPDGREKRFYVYRSGDSIMLTHASREDAERDVFNKFVQHHRCDHSFSTMLEADAYRNRWEACIKANPESPPPQVEEVVK